MYKKEHAYVIAYLCLKENTYERKGHTIETPKKTCMYIYIYIHTYIYIYIYIHAYL